MIQSILDKAGVTFSTTYCGEIDGTDAWKCLFVRGDIHAIFDYHTGLGLREVPEWKAGLPCYDNGPAPRCGTLLYGEWVALAKPAAPTAANVLYCLLLDSEASWQSFESWCRDLGFDSDSRKAEATYLECQANGDKLALIFTPAQIDGLREATRDI